MMIAVHRHLLLRALLPLAAVLVVFAAAAVFVVSAKGRRDALAALTSKAQVTAEILARSVAGPVWDLDTELTVSILTAAGADPDYAGSRIIDENGKLLAQHGSSTDVGAG